MGMERRQEGAGAAMRMCSVSQGRTLTAASFPGQVRLIAA